VPLHLRNAPTKLMEELNYSKGYKYAHDFENNFTEQQFLPENLKDKIYYKPTDNGREKTLRERLNQLWKRKKR
jgi:putative ATPase